MAKKKKKVDLKWSNPECGDRAESHKTSHTKSECEIQSVLQYAMFSGKQECHVGKTLLLKCTSS